VNQEHLSHIVKQPVSISGQDALELEALCKKFPAFSTPFVLLARYYWQTGDYRMEEAVQQAALRVNDREWLYDFVHATAEKANTDIAKIQETEIPFSEPLESEIDIQVEQLSAVVETITETVELETNPQEIEIQIEVQIEEQTVVSSMFEPEDSENLVFDEIEALDAAVGASILGITGLDYAQANPTIENDASGEIVTDVGGLITPMSAEEDNIETAAISIFEVDDDLADEHHAAANEYNIEQFYPTPAETVSGPPTDFYSWLGQPAAQQEEETVAEETAIPVSEQELTHQQQLIDRFIANNPSISRPKKEFFTPETAAKKSEHLPEQLATETLATVYLNQGNAEGAIRIYERLILKFPEKSSYFVSLIEKTRNEFNL
jgi:tetratricopeptide (TPR) repeat protein